MNITSVQNLLETEFLGRNFVFLNSVDSTNNYLKERWQFLKHGCTVVAETQLSGRGRTGKSFFSPPKTGLYMSFLLRGKKYASDALITAKMSYALCKAVDKLTDTSSAGIKWVNDVYVSNKKIAGILCEKVSDGRDEAVIVGIGVNFSLDRLSLPSDIKNTAGSLRDITKKKLHRSALCAYVLNEVEKIYSEDLSGKKFISEYRNRSIVLGKEITVIKGDKKLRAAAVDIDSNGALAVRYENGFTEKLSSGEISILV